MPNATTTGSADGREDHGGGEGPTDDARGAVGRTAERDRTFARRIGLTALGWAAIWSVIIAALFLFGDAIAAVVV